MAAFVAGLTGRIPLADDDEVFALILQSEILGEFRG